MKNLEIQLSTSVGNVCVIDSGGTGVPILFIHGNSFSSAVFDYQLNGMLTADHRLLAIDLPGHGKSDDANDPEKAYTLPGYAGVVREIIDGLDLSGVVLFGWSLGGHVALELIADNPASIDAVAICGCPPIGRDPADIGNAFNLNSNQDLIFKDKWSEQEARAFVENVTGYSGEAVPGPFIAAAARADGRARSILAECFLGGKFHDEVALVGESTIPLALIEGADDPFVRRDYLDGLTYANRWHGKSTIIENAGHLPFWQQPETFDGALKRFIKSIES